MVEGGPWLCLPSGSFFSLGERDCKRTDREVSHFEALEFKIEVPRSFARLHRELVSY